MEKNKNPERIKTGIKGFDALCQGGLIKNSVNLVSGRTGSGKSIFGLQFLYHGALNGENGLYISFEEDPKELIDDATSLGWDFEKMQAEHKISFVHFYPYELEHWLARLIKEAITIDAKRIVVDSTSAFGMALENDYEVRKQLFALIRDLKKLECTSILISEVDARASTDNVSKFGVEEYICDGVIYLHHDLLNKKEDKSVSIIKMRRTNHVKGKVAMKITNKGVEISKSKVK